MKKIFLVFSFLFILQSPTLRSQTIDVTFIGRITTDFSMPSSNYGSNINLADITSNSNDSSLIINLNIKTIQIIDTLNIFIGLYDYPISLISNNNYYISFDSSIFNQFNCSFGMYQNNIEGLVITSILKDETPFVIIKIDLLEQNFDFTENLNITVKTNIPRGDVAWFPLQKGNIWEYNEYTRNTGVYVDYQYEILDSLFLQNTYSFIIKKSKIENGILTIEKIDTIQTNLTNDIVDMNNHRYWPQFYPGWYDEIKYVQHLGKIAYITYVYDGIPGIETSGTASANVGFLNYFSSMVGFPAGDDITLTGAKINNTIVYGTITDIKENFTSQPNTFLLSQNYPNPFNPSTKIKYAIPASLNPSEGGTLVTLKVYDLLGREVATLVNEEKPTGIHEIEFNGNIFPSGVYFYRLQTVGLVETKKMVLLQ